LFVKATLMKARVFQRLACTFLILFLSALEAVAEKRVALVIGNGAYQSTAALSNPANDASDMAAALKEVGFEVILARDVDKRAMERAIVQFARLSQDADASLFYYAGHGIQHRGNNYLVPIDARLEDEFSLNFELARVSDVITALEQARGVKVLILDACRNNPLADKLTRLATNRQFGTTRGLARIDAIRGRNSPFTRSLLKQIAEPGVEIGTLFRRVAMDVNHATGGRQLPELSVSLFGEFYLNTRETDLQAWARIRNTNDPASLQEFLQQYPRSALATDARMRIAAIERENAERERQRRLQEEREQARREQERLEREQAERKRLEAERLERERLAREAAEHKQSEQERLEAERIGRERLASEAAERERMRKEQERVLREYAERERLARERLASEIAEREQGERQRLAKEFAEREKEREEQERQWRERAEKAQREREALARQLAERERRDREAAEAEQARLALLSKPDASVTPDAAKPREEPDVSRELQKELQRVGCYAGPIDGQWGPKSEAALRSFLRITGDAKTAPRPEPTALAAVAARKDRACPATASRPPPASPPSTKGRSAPAGDSSIRPRVGELRPRCFRRGDMSACRELCAYFGPQAGACARLRGGGTGLRRGYGLGSERRF